MSTFVSKPVEIEATQWGEPIRDAQHAETMAHAAERIVAWVNANGGEARYEQVGDITATARIMVRTNSGWAPAAPGWWVIKGSVWFRPIPPQSDPDGPILLDHYPCDPETFAKRWERKS